MLILIGSVTPAAKSQQPVSARPSLVFDQITVVDVEKGKLVPLQRVVIAGNRIQAVGPAASVPLPPDAQLVSAQGKYLIPGLWDLHAHTEFGAIDYLLLVANGVTGLRNPASSIPLDTLRRWRREILANTRIGPPRQILSGPSIEEAPPPTAEEPAEDEPTKAPPTETCGGPQQANAHSSGVWICYGDTARARQIVDSLKAAGSDMIKPRQVQKATYFVVAAEARRLGIPFGGHAHAVTALEAADRGASIIDHRNSAGGLDTLCFSKDASVERCQPVAERFRRTGTWFVPTMLLTSQVPWGGLGGIAGSIYDYLTEHEDELKTGSLLPGNWLRGCGCATPVGAPDADTSGSSHATLHIAQRVGLPILAGTDLLGPLMGFGLHAELAALVAEGLTPLTALQSATLNPAKLLHGTDSLGTVAPGKLADLVLLDANPLDDITNTTTIRAVVANGRYFDRAALGQLLIDARAKAKQEP